MRISKKIPFNKERKTLPKSNFTPEKGVFFE
jgi:hypothetical protein